MATTNEQFWHLATKSGLLTSERCKTLAKQAKKHDVGAGEDASALAEWLVANKVLTRYQATVLLSGSPGPFIYGDYLVLDRIAKGRLKGVLRAIHRPTKYKVFLRLLAGPATEDPKAIKAVAERTDAAARIRYDRLSHCYHLGTHKRRKFIVCEALEGRSLSEELARKRMLPAAEACRIASHCAQALAELHEHEILHTNIRPSNVWLLPDGRVKLLQLPLGVDPMLDSAAVTASLSRAAGALLKTGTEPAAGVARRLEYVAPELTQGKTTADVGEDIYALGCTLYAMLCGQTPPLGIDGVAQKLRFRNEREIPPLDGANPNVPRPVAKLVSFMLARDPASRYQAAAHLVEAMKPFVGEEDDLTEPPSPQAMAYQQWLAGPKSQAEPVAALDSSDEDFNDDVEAIAVGVGEDVPTGGMGSLTVSTDFHARRNSSGKGLIFVGIVALLLVVVGAVYWFLPGNTKPTASDATGTANEQVATNDGGSSATGIANAPTAEASISPTVRSPLGPPLWESPTLGEPLDLSYLPPGVQIVFSVRPSALVAHPEGEKLFDAAGRWGDYLRTDLVEAAGVPLANIERATIGLLDNSPNPPQRAWVIWTTQPIAWEQRLDEWEGGETFELTGQKVFQRDGIVYFAPPTGNDRQLVVAPREAAEAILASSGSPPRLRSELEILAEQSDADRMINVLFTPNFLFTGGKEIFADEAESLKRPVADFLGPEARGGLLSLHLDDDCFIELRLQASADRLPLVMGKEWRERVHEIPSRVSSHVWSLTPSPYSQKVLAQLPRMTEMLERYTRAAVEGRETILRCYLPVEAAHNLALATRLALMETSGAPALATQTSSQPELSVQEKLSQSYALKIPRGPLDQAVAQVSSDLGVEIEIIGGDLQLEGITKNQSFGIDIKDSTFSGVLREILKLANPDGKLVYVIKPKEEGGPDIVQITTRAAVEKRGDKLPPEFEAQ
ncbi:Probable serine/threonine-protein kinase CPE1738 [Durusdinium trenchii]|uniref:Probable serine/threonine-protein kinase CPE1738 n=2 Tax=Durusdinium trenchii TaxID=1381693 RepID=A0ABP0IHU1_9DINO